MYAGKLRHRLAVQTRQDAADSFGEPVSTWVDAGWIWASVVPVAGSETVESDRVSAEVTHRIETRWGARVTTRNRLRYPDSNGSERFFEVVSALNFEERNRELHLMCRELPDE